MNKYTFLFGLILIFILAVAIGNGGESFGVEAEARAEILKAQKGALVAQAEEDVRTTTQRNQLEETLLGAWADANIIIAWVWKYVGSFSFGLMLLGIGIGVGLVFFASGLDRAAPSIARALQLGQGVLNSPKGVQQITPDIVRLPGRVLVDNRSGRITLDGEANGPDEGVVLAAISKEIMQTKGGSDWIGGFAQVMAQNLSRRRLEEVE